MPKSFIKFKPITGNSEKHNTREIKPKYLIPGSAENLSYADMTLKEKKEVLQKLVKEKTGRKMQAKATPIREAVILLKDDNNEVNRLKLFELSDRLEERFGICAFQWHIHNDEGHIDQKGKAKYNYHAHIVFDWTNKETGKSFKLDKKDMSEIQSITAEVLEMERGIKGSKSLSLNHHQYRGFLEIKDELEKSLKIELSREQQLKIRESIKEAQKQEYEVKRSDRTRGISR